MNYLRSKNLSMRAIVSGASLLAVLVVFGVPSVSAQSSLRKAVYGDNSTPKKAEARKRTESSKSSARATSKTRKSSADSSRKKSTRASSASNRESKRDAWINVVFESKEPNTQILLNGNHVGATDETLTLRRKMTPGIYRLTATHGIKIVFPEKAVQLGKDEMVVQLVPEEIAEKEPEKEAQPLVIPKTQAEIEMEMAREMSARVIQIFSDYLDPERSASVTVEDWQFAMNAAVLGEFQNLSKQQIEAQRKFASGQVSLAEKNFQKAFTDFRTATQIYIGSPLAYIGIGDAYAASAQWQDARRAYEQARSVGPSLWMTHRRLADTYRLLREDKKAAQSYGDAIKNGDTRSSTRFLRARSLVDAENMEEAIPLLQGLANEDPRSEIYLALGEAFESLKRDIGALDHYRKAVELDPESPVARYRLARIYYEQREYQKAVDGFNEALKLDGDKKSFSHDDAAEKKSAALGRIRSATR